MNRWRLLLIGLAIAGCTSSGYSSSSSGGFVGGSSGGASSSGSRPPEKGIMVTCAGATPGAGCPIDLPPCELGDHATTWCNKMLRCCDGVTALEQHSCITACPAAHVTEAPDACVTAPETTVCEYPEGTCGCARPHLDGGTVDGGDAGGAYAWTCVVPAEGCPRMRPRLGEPCVRPMRCDYGSSVFDHGVALSCVDRVWTLADAPQLCSQRP